MWHTRHRARYQRQNHPLLSLCLADGEHALSTRKRWLIEMVVLVSAGNVEFTDGGYGVTGDWGLGSTLLWALLLLLFRATLLALAVCPCLRFNEVPGRAPPDWNTQTHDSLSSPRSEQPPPPPRARLRVDEASGREDALARQE